jgi:hypothetical protein
MSTDYAEKEREFLATLEEDTGRGLAAWMEAISAQGLANKNEIIDWLRQQGFMFSKASWLERIHDNGGKPIYAPATGPGRVAASDEILPAAAPPAQKPVTRQADEISEPEPMPVPAPPTSDALGDLLARAKAMRPLAQHVLGLIAKTVPGTRLLPRASHVSLERHGEFAVLTVGQKELRLGLALADKPADEALQPAKFANPALRISPAITHMVILTDARQVNAGLLAAIRRAAGLEAG